MPYADVFDLTTPTGAEGLSNGDDRIREFKRALSQRLLTLVEDVDADPLVLLASQLIPREKIVIVSARWLFSGSQPSSTVRDVQGLSFLAGAVSAILTAVVQLPVGFTAAHVRLKGTNTGTGGALTATFRKVDAAGTVTDIVTCSTVAGGGAQTIEQAVSVTVAADEIYGFHIGVTQTSGSTIICDRVEIDQT